jgi:hypothetical protein
MKTVIRVGYVFALLGVVMLVLGVVFYDKKQSFVANSVITNGKVVDVEQRRSTDSDGYASYSYYPVCEFITADGRTILFTSGIGSNPSSYDVNEEVEIRYDPDNPQKASINSFFNIWMAPFILGLLGLIFLLVGISMILTRYKNRRKRERLMLEGTKITSKFSEVLKNTSITVNSKHPYQIITHYEMNNELFVFKSENIWYNPAMYIDREEIDVWVNPMNMKKYYMDVSFLPKRK